MTCTLTDGARKFRRWRYYRPTQPHLEGPSRLKSTYSTRLAGLRHIVDNPAEQTTCLSMVRSDDTVTRSTQRLCCMETKSVSTPNCKERPQSPNKGPLRL